MKKRKSEQGLATQQLEEMSSKLTITDNTIVWKKEGLKKQYQIAGDVTLKLVLGISKLEDGEREKALCYLKQAKVMLKSRMKQLRIADKYEGGWETVSAYTTDPIASDSDDDKKLWRADKSALESIARRSKSRKPDGRGGKRPSWSNKDDSPNRCKSLGGKKSTSSSQATAVIPRKRRKADQSDLCFRCGNKGHWAHKCPEKDADKSD